MHLYLFGLFLNVERCMWKGEMGELREGTVCVCVCVCAHAIFLTKCNDCFDGRLYACVRAFSCVCVLV